jgi:hypothetical protein
MGTPGFQSSHLGDGSEALAVSRKVGFYNDIPGVEVEGLPTGQRMALIQDLNKEACTCGCRMTLAECRDRDPFCQLSVSLAQDAVLRFRARAQVRN